MGFVDNFDCFSSLHSEICGIMCGIQIAHSRGWNKLWLDTDSAISLLALRDSSLMPWHLRNRWLNCKLFLTSMSFFITHIYREGN